MFGLFDVVVHQPLEKGQRQPVVQQHRAVEVFDVEIIAEFVHRVLAKLENLQHPGFVGGEVADVIEVEVDLLSG